MVQWGSDKYYVVREEKQDNYRFPLHQVYLFEFIIIIIMTTISSLYYNLHL